MERFSRSEPAPRDPSTMVHSSGATAAGIFRCPVTHPLHRDSGPITAFVVAFPRTTGWLCHEGGKPIVISPAMATIYNRGQRYTRRRIAASGDYSDWIAITDLSVAHELAGVADPFSADSPERPFRFPYARIPASLYARQRQFFCDVRNGRMDSLQAEEEVLALFRHVLGAMRTTWSIEARAVAHERSEDFDRVQAVLALLGERFREPLRLDELARAAGVSAVHLTRLFRRHTGTSIHQALNDIRLRAALGAIRHPKVELTEVALELGFSSHSHFTEAFRRKFGAAPSRVRRRLGLSTPDARGWFESD